MINVVSKCILFFSVTVIAVGAISIVVLIVVLAIVVKW